MPYKKVLGHPHELAIAKLVCCNEIREEVCADQAATNRRPQRPSTARSAQRPRPECEHTLGSPPRRPSEEPRRDVIAMWQSCCKVVVEYLWRLHTTAVLQVCDLRLLPRTHSVVQMEDACLFVWKCITVRST